MASRSGSPGRLRRATVAVITLALLASLPASAWAAEPGTVGETIFDPSLEHVGPGQGPSQAYLDMMAAESRHYSFEPGGRVTVGFRPRPDDRWPVDGAAPRALPAGRLSGEQMAGVGTAAAATPTPETPTSALGTTSLAPATQALGQSPEAALAQLPGGMRRVVYGYLPWWEVGDATTRVDFRIVTHMAYFSVGVDANGNLRTHNADGTPTTGWAGWNSARMTSLIEDAHRHGSRVTLTVTMFAWTSGQAATQAALLGSATARQNLARQAAAAVRNRGVGGVNLNIEPLVAGHEANFVALVRTVRAELDAIAPGYHLSFTAMGHPGNYPLEQALAPGGADAVFVMGYDYRTAGSNHAGSISPLAGPRYDLTETVRAYTARLPASQVILGLPWYGRAWSTVSDALNARTQTGTRYGESVAVNYEFAVDLVAQHGRRFDATEVSAWTAFQRQNCTAAYGCVTTWRQLYFDDAETLKARFDLVNRASLRGVGIWALGYDGARPELYQALADKFLDDTTGPLAGIDVFPAAARPDEGFLVSWSAVDDWSGIASHDVEVSTGGGPWAAWLTGTTATSATFLGVDGQGYAFRVRARDGRGNVSSWNVSSVHVASPALAPGGFLRVAVDSLNVRSGPSTNATRVTSAPRDAVFAITGGPTVADGHTWYEVTGPLLTWGPVADVLANVWVAAASATATLAVATPPPNSTLVAAAIRQVGFSGAGAASLGTDPAAIAARSFSPNGDGSADRLAISWDNREAFDALELRVLQEDGALLGSIPLATLGAGRQDYEWDGSVVGVALPDGAYVLQLVGTRGGVQHHWPAASPTADGIAARVRVVIDRVPLTLSVQPGRFSPNGDGVADTTRLSWTSPAPVTGTLLILRDATTLRTWRISGVSGEITWDGRDAAGRLVADGRLQVAIRPDDALANRAGRSAEVVVDRTAGLLRWSPFTFFPQDGDGLAATATVSVRLARAARVSLRVIDAAGNEVRRAWSNRELGAGTHSWRWDGRTTDGAWAPQGRYVAEVTATSWLGTTVLRRTVAASAFRVTLPSPLPAAGSRLSVTIRSVEPLAANPSAWLWPAGRQPIRMAVTRLADGSWRATLDLPAGVSGPARLSLLGRDTAGGRNRMQLPLTLP
jgi:spore germination protein YaaH/flagellar hook assembly protein FlgD